MKKLFYSGLICMFMLACGQTGTDKSSDVADLSESGAKVHVYYFHGKQRCTTCLTVQQVAEEAMAEHFSGNKNVAFVEVDFSEAANAALAEKYEIVFSSLVIADETDYKDITGDAFAMAIGNPEGLKDLIAFETNAFLSK